MTYEERELIRQLCSGDNVETNPINHNSNLNKLKTPSSVRGSVRRKKG